MQILDAPLHLVNRIVTQTPTDGPGIANVKTVFASILKEINVLGAADIVTARYALLLDAATTGSGSAAVTRLAALSEASSEANRRVGLFLRTVVRLYVATYEACITGLEAALRANIVASETVPGALLVSASRLRASWERLRMDVNSLTAPPLVKLTNESKLLTVPVKQLCDQIFAESPIQDAKAHGLLLPSATGGGREDVAPQSRRSSRRPTAGSTTMITTSQAPEIRSDPAVGDGTDLMDATLIAALLRTVLLRITVQS